MGRKGLIRWGEIRNFTVPWDYPTTIATGEVIIYEYYEGVKKHGDKICLREMGPVNATVVGILD